MRHAEKTETLHVLALCRFWVSPGCSARAVALQPTFAAALLVDVLILGQAKSGLGSCVCTFCRCAAVRRRSLA